MPMCPVHHSPMLKSRKGSGFFCSKQYEDGTYCQEKAAAPAPAAAPSPPPTQGAAHAGNGGASRADVVMAAALHFAGNLYSGMGPSAVPDALKAAQSAYAAMMVFQP